MDAYAAPPSEGPWPGRGSVSCVYQRVLVPGSPGGREASLRVCMWSPWSSLGDRLRPGPGALPLPPACFSLDATSSAEFPAARVWVGV